MIISKDTSTCGITSLRNREFFDLDDTYTLSYISRLLGISERLALRYVDKQGKLTEKGIEVLQSFNDELSI